jgi:hypothetical protein
MGSQLGIKLVLAKLAGRDGEAIIEKVGYGFYTISFFGEVDDRG